MKKKISCMNNKDIFYESVQLPLIQILVIYSSKIFQSSGHEKQDEVGTLTTKEKEGLPAGNI